MRRNVQWLSTASFYSPLGKLTGFQQRFPELSYIKEPQACSFVSLLSVPFKHAYIWYFWYQILKNFKSSIGCFLVMWLWSISLVLSWEIYPYLTFCISHTYPLAFLILPSFHFLLLFSLNVKYTNIYFHLLFSYQWQTLKINHGNLKIYESFSICILESYHQERI